MDYRNNVERLRQDWRDEGTERRWMLAYWATVIVGGLVMFYAGTGGL